MKFAKRVEAAADRGDLGPLLRWGVKWLLVLIAVGFALRLVLAPVNYAAKAGAVILEELDPRVLLTKYQWFKDAHAALDAKQATIKTYQHREAQLRALYGSAAAKWPRDVREEWALQASEVAGVIASYNTLAADYNAQMAKLNWRFTNVGGLPQGATEPLPREYAPYKEGP